jgi:molybdate transport repressor ModE-like protein
MRHLEALKAVAEEGTFAEAARRLGYTQSAISQQIRALERITGRRMIDRPRGRRPTGLTEAGRRLLHHSEAMLAQVQAAHADLEAVQPGQSGRLRVGTYQSTGSRILPKVVRRFRTSFPDVEIELHESASDVELLELVEHGRLDVTFCMLPLEDGPFEAAELLADPYLLVLPRSSRLCRTQHPTAKEVAAIPLVGFRSCRNHHRVEAQLGARGVRPTIVFRSDDNGTMQALVGAGLGGALMPRLTVDIDDRRTRCIKVDHLFPPRLLGLVWHAEREPTQTLETFIAIAKRLCPSFAPADVL